MVYYLFALKMPPDLDCVSLLLTADDATVLLHSGRLIRTLIPRIGDIVPKFCLTIRRAGMRLQSHSFMAQQIDITPVSHLPQFLREMQQFFFSRITLNNFNDVFFSNVSS